MKTNFYNENQSLQNQVLVLTINILILNSTLHFSDFQFVFSLPNVSYIQSMYEPKWSFLPSVIYCLLNYCKHTSHMYALSSSIHKENDDELSTHRTVQGRYFAFRDPLHFLIVVYSTQYSFRLQALSKIICNTNYISKSIENITITNGSCCTKPQYKA